MATPLGPTQADQSAYLGDARSSWDRRKWYILAAICVAQFMVVLDIAVVNVALPSIRTDLHFTVESLQWVLSAYAIFFGGFLLLGGRLADVLGRRRVFMAGLVIFAGASLACGLAWSEISLIAFRASRGWAARCSRRRPCRSSSRPSPKAASATSPWASGAASPAAARPPARCWAAC